MRRLDVGTNPHIPSGITGNRPNSNIVNIVQLTCEFFGQLE